MTVRAIVVALALAGAVRAEEVLIELDADLPIGELLDRMQEQTGLAVLYDPNGQRIRGQTIGSRITHRVPRERLFDTYRAMLAFYELTLVPVGPEDYPVYLVLDSRSTNSTVRNKARFVTLDELEGLADQDGLYVSCAIPVRHLENLTVLRAALSTLVSPAGIGRVAEVGNGRAIVVMDFAPTAAMIARLVGQMDVPVPGAKWTMDLIRLEHAWAPDLADVLAEVLERAPATPAPARRGAPAAPPGLPAPKVRAYERLNALAVGATADDLALVRALVAQLDAPASAGRALEVVRLSHRRAEDVAAALGAGATAVVHPSTNALLLAGDEAAVARAKRLARLLDRPPI